MVVNNLYSVNDKAICILGSFGPILRLPMTCTRQIAQVSHSTSQIHIATAFHFFKVNILVLDLGVFMSEIPPTSISQQ